EAELSFPMHNLECVTPALLFPTETQPTSTVLRVKESGPEMCIHLKDQMYRLCVDYRALNDCTIKDTSPTPQTPRHTRHPVHGKVV
ncbi:hypothetical protein QQF64_034209, partial [Cirrhinus molitorella]